MEDPAKFAGGKLGEYSYTADATGMRVGDRSASDVLRDIVGNVQEIIRSEARLARAEVREEAGKFINASTLFAAGAVLGIFALGFVFWSFAYLLSAVMRPWLATLLVGLVLGAIAGALVMTGRGRLQAFHAKPDKTIDTMKENIEWIKNQTKS